MLKKIFGAVGVILAAVFLYQATQVSVPSDYINYYGMQEYVGGDAYNYIIAANIRSAEIISATFRQAVYYAAAGVIFVISLFGFVPEKKTAQTSAAPAPAAETAPAAHEEIMPIAATTVDLPPMDSSSQES